MQDAAQNSCLLHMGREKMHWYGDALLCCVGVQEEEEVAVEDPVEESHLERPVSSTQVRVGPSLPEARCSRRLCFLVSCAVTGCWAVCRWLCHNSQLGRCSLHCCHHPATTHHLPAPLYTRARARGGTHTHTITTTTTGVQAVPLEMADPAPRPKLRSKVVVPSPSSYDPR